MREDGAAARVWLRGAPRDLRATSSVRALAGPVLPGLGAPAPMLSPHELDKICVTHYASIDKARAELGYAPPKSVAIAMHEYLQYCKSTLERKA